MGGLSGIDTGSLIDSLMKIEATSQDRIKSNISTKQSVLTALQSLSTSVKSLMTKSQDLSKPKAWDTYAVTSSKTTVAASGASGAMPGSYTFDVVATAAAHRTLYGGSVASSDTVASGGALTFTRADGSEVEVAVTNKTLQGTIAAINAKEDLGIRASAVDMGNGRMRLQLASAATGEAGAFTVSGLDSNVGSPAVVTQGRDAAIQVGPDPVADRISSSSNTFTNVFPGLTFTVTGQETGVVLDVTSDSKGLTAQMKGLVDSVNSILSTIATQTAYTPPIGSQTKGTSGVLAGDSAVRSLSSTLRDAIFDPNADVSLSTIGIQLTQGGQLKFDEKAFADALAKDPGRTRDLADGLAERMAGATAPTVDRQYGSLTRAIASQQGLIKDLNDRVADWDIRLALRRESLEKQFTAMSVSLSSLNSQQSYLSSRLASLNKQSS
jgi:flagellar hook-associated protein 2